MSEMTKIFEIISSFNSPWQVLGFAIVVAFIFGCLYLLYKIWFNILSWGGTIIAKSNKKRLYRSWLSER